jgi:glycosyltransferase involved in cell wall biosynthesis
MTFSIMITTRNRAGELRRTAGRLVRLDPAPLEVLICADGCTDETAAMIRRDFPAFRLVENETPCGSVFSRDRLLRLAQGDVVVSLDDDSYPVDDDFLARLAGVMAAHPEAAVVTFPELRDAGFAAATLTDRSGGAYVSAYPNCAAAMKRAFYLQSAGYPLFFEHAYEEPDYALQCYGAGAAVWFEPSLVIRHHRSPVQRSAFRTHHFNARNELWSVWLRCPWPWLPVVSLFRIARQFRYACTEGAAWARCEPQWWLAALGGVAHCVRHRRPIPWRRYYAWMKLARQPLGDRADLEARFR